MEEAKIFVAFLQSCISPIILISGVGLILLSVTNRLGRTIDRSRILVNELEQLPKDGREREIKIVQLKMLSKRSRILKSSIMSISFSILCSSFIIPVLLVMYLLDADLKVAGIALFLLSILGIILSAVFLFIDVTLTLNAFEYQIKEHIGTRMPINRN